MNDTDRGLLADILPCLGFDLLTHLLVSFNKDDRYDQYLKAWLSAFTEELDPYSGPWAFGRQFFSRYDDAVAHDSAIFLRGLRQESCRNRLAIFQLNEGVPWKWCFRGDRDPWAHQHYQHELQLMMYRQRAWGFFDDARLYPDMAKHFPTMDDLDEQDLVTFRFMGGSEERIRRRSQSWQDWYSGRCIERPLNKERQEPPEEAELVEDNYDPLPRFFEKPSSGKIATFWRRDSAV
jgi:hypothetical protein